MPNVQFFAKHLQYLKVVFEIINHYIISFSAYIILCLCRKYVAYADTLQHVSAIDLSV